MVPIKNRLKNTNFKISKRDKVKLQMDHKLIQKSNVFRKHYKHLGYIRANILGELKFYQGQERALTMHLHDHILW